MAFPSLVALGVDPSNASKETIDPKRVRLADQAEDAPLVGTLEGLPLDVFELVLDALRQGDCKKLGRICVTSRTFAAMCREPAFWQAALRAKGWMPDESSGAPLGAQSPRAYFEKVCGWMPDWSSHEAPGGMSPKAYVAMVEGMSEEHRRRFLALSTTTTEIERGAFQYCTSLALTHLPPNLTSIGVEAFEGCEALALTHLPPNLEYIGEWAFHGCEALALTHLPHNLASIGEWTFKSCTSLALTHLPSNLTEIGRGAFLGCSQLRGDAFEDAVRAINRDGFAYWP